MLTLYSRFVNSAGERVRIALALKAIDYRYVSIEDLGRDRYRELNPQGLLPALEVDGQIFAQATAILEYLEESYPEPALLPADPLTRARARAFAQHITSEMHAIDVIRVRRFLGKQLGVDEAGVDAWQAHWFKTGFTALETALRERAQSFDYCYSDTPGWADLHLVPQVRKATTRFEVAMSFYPTIMAVAERAMAHPAFIAAAPENQTDYPGELG